MAREKESYRDNLERLDKAFPTKELLNASDVAEFTGIHRHSVKATFTFNKYGRRHLISKAVLARELS